MSDPMRELTLRGRILLSVILSAAWLYDIFRVKDETESQTQQASIIVSLIIAAVLFVVAELTKPSPQIEEARPKGLGDFSFPTATEGRAVPLLFGRCLIEGPNVVWFGDFEQRAILGSFRKNLLSSKRTFVKGYRYLLGMQMAICRGPIDAVNRIFIGKKQAWPADGSSAGAQVEGTIQIDLPELFGGEQHGQGGIQADVDVFIGTITQPISPYLGNNQDSGAGTNRTPRYTGTSYLIARELNATTPLASDGAYLGTSTTIKPWSFEAERYPPIFSGQGAGEHKVGAADCNPMNVAYELFTDPEWGLNESNAEIDLVSFKAAADTLRDELNGFSMVIDRVMTATDFLHEIERQIDGVFFLDHSTGKWTVKLARDDYVVANVPQLNNTNISKIEEFTQGSYAATSNQVQARFNKRGDNYKESFAFAQDMANAIAQGDGTVISGRKVATQEFFPGVKLSQLAADLAWRQLRFHAYPLVKATFTVNREFWELHPGDVVAWTDADQGFDKLPMRVTRIDYGSLDANIIKISCVQDVFYTFDPSFGVPPETNWEPTPVIPIAYPTDQQLAFEAPRAFRNRDPEITVGTVLSSEVAKIWCGVRNQAGELSYQIHERHSSGTPSGTYAADSSEGSVRFFRMGTLKSDLDPAAANPATTITLAAGPDTQATLQGEFLSSTGPSDLGGTDLLNLLLVNGEFMIVTSAVNASGTDVDLQTVYRGVMDTTQQYHSAGDDVYYVFVGGTLTDTTFDNTDNVDIKLLAVARQSVLAIGDATEISISLSGRNNKPYPPSAILIDTVTYDPTPSLEGGGSGLDGFLNNLTIVRKDFNLFNEVDAIVNGDRGNAEPSGAPIGSSYEFEVRADPDGANTEIVVSSFIASSSSTNFDVLRTSILRHSPNGAAGAELQYLVDTQFQTGETAHQRLEWRATPTSALTSQVALGARGSGLSMVSYVTATSGTFLVTVGTALSGSSRVEVSINGGAFSTVFTAPTTSGNVVIASSSDTITLRHTDVSTLETFVELQDPSTAPVAYGVFFV